jgi:hypothetical protein
MQNDNKRIIGTGNIGIENLSVNALAKKMRENAPLKAAVVCLIQAGKPKDKLREIKETIEVMEAVRKNIFDMNTKQTIRQERAQKKRSEASALYCAREKAQ